MTRRLTRTEKFWLEGIIRSSPTSTPPGALPRSQAQQQQVGQLPLEQYAAAGSGSAGIQGNAGLMQEPGQQQQQQQQQQQYQQELSQSSHPGSYHFGSIPGNELSTNTIQSSATAFPSNSSAPPTTTTNTTTPTEARNDAARTASLTALPPPDPANSLPNQAFPNRPPPPSSHVPKGFPAANEVDHPMTDWNAQSAAPENRLDSRNHSQDNTASSGESGVDFQNLLDNLPSSTAVPPAPAVSETAPSSMNKHASAIPQATAIADGASDEAHRSSLGLPPRPPPQEEPNTHPNYNPSDDIRTYHQLPSQSSIPTTSYSAQQQSNNNPQSSLGAPALAAAGAPGTSSGINSLPPPPGLSLQKSESSSAEPQESPTLKNGRLEKQAIRPLKNSDEDAPWGPEVQRKYDDFLHQERIYVTEGLWDRFPSGSRLFVGKFCRSHVRGKHACLESNFCVLFSRQPSHRTSYQAGSVPHLSQIRKTGSGVH